MDRVNYWIGRGAQPTDTVRQLIRRQAKAETEAAAQPEA
jgi:ribosomal protein S16